MVDFRGCFYSTVSKSKLDRFSHKSPTLLAIQLLVNHKTDRTNENSCGLNSHIFNSHFSIKSKPLYRGFLSKFKFRYFRTTPQQADGAFAQNLVGQNTDYHEFSKNKKQRPFSANKENHAASRRGILLD